MSKQVAIGNARKRVLKPGNYSNIFRRVLINFISRDRTREKSEGKDRKRERSTQPDAESAKKSRTDDLKKDLDTLIRQEESKLKVKTAFLYLNDFLLI